MVRFIKFSFLFFSCFLMTESFSQKGAYQEIYERHITPWKAKQEEAKRKAEAKQKEEQRRIEEEKKRQEEAKRKAEAKKKLKAKEQQEKAKKRLDICLPRQSGDKGIKRVCFFALNGPEESEHLDKEIEGLGSCHRDENKRLSCTTQAGEQKLEIKEFFADTNKSNRANVSQAFEKMTNTHCDGLVISGYHVGYYSGLQTTQGNRYKDKVDLNLTFLEKLSCLQRDDKTNCKPWFNNIQFLHLHGSRTAGNLEGKADDIALGVMRKYPDENWNPSRSTYMTREYASTVDQSNILSDRFLRMFPNSQVFAWSGHAPLIEQGSPQNFVDFVKSFSVLNEGNQEKTLEKGLSQFFEYINSKDEKICRDIVDQWARIGDTKSFYVSDKEKNENEKARTAGCDFSNAIDNGDKDKVLKNLDQIIPDYIHQNLNRIFHALNEESPLDNETKKAIINKLKKSQEVKNVFIGEIRNPDLGLVRRADYLYLYKKLDPEKSSAEISSFLKEINDRYDRLDQMNLSESVKNSAKGMLSEILWKNELDEKNESISTLIGKLKGESSASLKTQALILDRMNNNKNLDTDWKKDVLRSLDWQQKANLARDLTFASRDSRGQVDLQPVLSMYNQYVKGQNNETYEQSFKEIGSGILHQLKKECKKQNNCTPQYIDKVFKINNRSSLLEKRLHQALRSRMS